MYSILHELFTKTFVFFLISQPLIYFSESVIESLTTNTNLFERFWFYIDQYYIHGGSWGTWTLLTIPGAFIAYQIKNNNVLSGIVLSVATCYLAFAGTQGLLGTIINHFPYHLLNDLICLAAAFLLIFIILKNKKARIIALIITSLGLIGGTTYFIESEKTNAYWEEQNRLEIERLDAENVVQ